MSAWHPASTGVSERLRINSQVSSSVGDGACAARATACVSARSVVRMQCIVQADRVAIRAALNTPCARVADELAPQIADRLARYEIHTALFIPASRLCHQTLAIIARAVEASGIPTMLLSVDPNITDKVRPPRAAYYNGEFGSVAGKPNWREYQLRVLDEALRWTETFDQPGSRKLAVDLETQVEAARGER